MRNTCLCTSCIKPCHCYDDDFKYKKCAYTPCHHHACCANRCCCRKNLCSSTFSVRLAGLQDGLNFRLSQLLWCKAEFELDNGATINGTIVTVGTNFVEVLAEDSRQLTDPASKASNKKHSQKKHNKCQTWIFSIDKIANIQPKDSCHCKCAHHKHCKK